MRRWGQVMVVVALGGLVAGFGVAGCGGGPRSHRASASADAVIRLVGGPGDATVWVDGRFVADLATLRSGLALAAGIHRIEIRHDAYFAAYLELEVRDRERREVPVAMAPMLD